MNDIPYNSNRPKIVRVARALKELGFSRATLYRKVNAGEFKIVKRGSLSYVKTEEIDRFLDPNEQQMVG